LVGPDVFGNGLDRLKDLGSILRVSHLDIVMLLQQHDQFKRIN
jgi:hypothetical protein